MIKRKKKQNGSESVSFSTAENWLEYCLIIKLFLRLLMILKKRKYFPEGKCISKVRYFFDVNSSDPGAI